MSELFRNFGIYFRESQFDSLTFWAFPILTALFIWIATVIGLKVFSRGEKLKTIFHVNRAWIISSLVAAGILIGLICFWWTQNYFAKHPYQFSLLISLTLSLVIPIISFCNLRSYYTQEGIKEIIDQPKTENQLNETIVSVKKAFINTKYFYLIPLLGFLFLLLFFYKGTNLITIVYDNSGSMVNTNAINALSETFDNLEKNNEITFTTLDGFSSPDDPVGKPTMKDLMQVYNSSLLKGGKIYSYTNPEEAKNGLFGMTETCNGSPICESIWKTYLFTKDTKSYQTYKNRLLIVITDGQDKIDPTLNSGKFFFDDEGFTDLFSPEKVFIIDFSGGTPTSFMQHCENSGCDIYSAENNKQAYLDALDNALQSFKNNWYFIYWIIIIFFIFTIAGIIIQPNKII